MIVSLHKMLLYGKPEQKSIGSSNWRSGLAISSSFWAVGPKKALELPESVKTLLAGIKVASRSTRSIRKRRPTWRETEARQNGRNTSVGVEMGCMSSCWSKNGF